MGQLTPSEDKDIQKFQRAATDDEASVRIAAARSLYWAGHKEPAIRLLEKELKNFDEQEEVLHFALVVLQNTGQDAKAVLETVRQLNTVRAKTQYINRIAKHLIEKLQVK